MNSTRKIQEVVIATLVFQLWGLESNAHHDVLDAINLNNPFEIVGQVAAVDLGRPHSTLEILIRRVSGKDQIWRIQMDDRRALSERGFTDVSLQNLEWVKVIVYLPEGSVCVDECNGYGLSLTDTENNSYTLSNDISARLRQLKVE